MNTNFNPESALVDIEVSEAPTLPLTQDPYLQDLIDRQVSVSIYLVNGIKLQGQIKAHDKFVLFFSSTTQTQMVYKHAVSTVVPGIR